ncbi:hypothetical protein HK100_009223 [Physocladia obscura]|uniref:BZIP domain-containing protein n=1 Tax=Physocladia obscura TaxID=109957 RepID=A0AAD5XI38_9FUNG|nr:hypothetical protein HK100_009223 [Physocladia obscura]
MGDTDNAENSGSRYNPYSNRGRRKQSGEASGKRQVQMRDAQRALRARKQEYILDLQKKNLNLTHQNILLQQQVQILSIAFPSASSTVPCFNQNCAAQIQALQLEVLELQTALLINNNDSTALPAASSGLAAGIKTDNWTIDIEPEVSPNDAAGLESIINTSNGTIADSPSNWIDEMENIALKQTRKWQSAEDLYGPVDVAPFIARAKLIKSFKNTKIAERIFNLFALRIFFRCPIVDRVLFVEIMSEYHIKYKLHNIRWREICAFEAQPPKIKRVLPETISPRIINFRNTLKQIPSFSNHHDIIDRMCEFWNSDDQYGPEEFYYLNYLVHSLMVACDTVEDHIKFWLAFFIVRQNKIQEMDEVIANLEVVSL